MQAIPMEWVDKLFNCMEEFYGDKWKARLNTKKGTFEPFYKTIWQNGLTGLTYDEIKNQLKRCKRHAQNPGAQPPIVTDFFKYAKEQSEPYIDYHPNAGKRGDPQIAKNHLTGILQKLKG